MRSDARRTPLEKDLGRFKTIPSRTGCSAGGYLIAKTSPEVGDQVALCLRSPSQGLQPEVVITQAAVVLRVDRSAEVTCPQERVHSLS